MAFSLLYWMQTDAPRPDGAPGYPGLYLRPDLTGTADGLAKYPYVRESRRIRAVFTVTEEHVGAAGAGHRAGQPGEGRAVRGQRRRWAATASTCTPRPAGDNYVDVNSLPFRIPLGALLPVRVREPPPGGARTWG